MALVDQIIAAKKSYDESDRPWLSKLADGQLAKIAASCGCTASADGAANKQPEATPTPPTDPGPKQPPVAATAVPEPTPEAPVAAAAPAPEKPLTAEEWIEKAPEHLRGVFTDLLAQRRNREAELCKEIVAQSGGAITEEYLASKNMGLNDLEVLSRATRKPDYAGRGMSAGDPIAQAGKPASAPRMPGIKIGTAAA